MIVKGPKEFFLARVVERGYTIDEVIGCVIFDDGVTVEVDTDHEQYPKPRKDKPTESSVGGPGTELSKLLKRFGIEPTPTCQCRAKAAQMDAWGASECEKPHRIDEVVAVMREEAKARGLPFIDAAGRVLVRLAIRNARRAAKG